MQVTQDVCTQVVLELRKEACVSKLTNCLDIGKFRFDVVEDTQNLVKDRNEGCCDKGGRANGKSEDCHAINRFRSSGEEVNASEDILAVMRGEGGKGGDVCRGCKDNAFLLL